MAARASRPTAWEKLWRSRAGGNLQELRQFLGYATPAAFARAVGLNPRTIRNLEAGRCSISNQTLFALMKKTGVDPEWLIPDPPRFRDRRPKPQQPPPPDNVVPLRRQRVAS